ncbi:MAG: CehA/McbA family metallohydrolase [Planctomycetales bacterium]|nr:CehA/McbA family metallohydrolase [Planctomycetales bacterium]
MRISALVTFVAMLGLIGFSDSREQSVCRVRLALTDAASGREIPGLIRITDADGKPIASEKLLSRGLGIEGDLPIHRWLVLPQATEIDLPRGKFAITAISGLETEQAQREVDLTGLAESKLSIPLTRFHNAAAQGYRPGNTHLHLMKISRADCDRYLCEVPLADRLDVMFLSYLERADADKEYTSNRYSTADLSQLTRQSGVLFGNGEEHRHNFAGWGEGYGHVMFLNIKQLIQPVSIGPGIMLTGHDGLPLQRGIDQARKDGATVIWCHNEWGLEALPNWLTGRVQAQNIFDGGIRSSYKDSFYRYLNAGLRVPFSTGTDWFMYDFSRAYVRMDGDLTTSNWLKQLAAGRSFITNGPLLDLRVAGRSIGDTVKLPNAGTVEVIATASGRVDFQRIELIQNGTVIATASTTPVGGHFEAEFKQPVNISKSCWLALRTPPPSVKDDPELAKPTPLNEFGKELFSHTSPIYIELAGRRMFDSQVARELLEKMKANRDQLVKHGKFEDDLARERVLDVYRDGIAALEKRIAE